MNVLGLYATRDGMTLYVGRGSEAAMTQSKRQWEDAGWACSFKTGRPQNLRPVYEPVRCPLCSWAGLNLATHWVRVHPNEELPKGTKLVAKPIHEANKRARNKQELTRRPRAGQLIVYRNTSEDVEVWTIVRLTVGDGVIIRRLDRNHVRSEVLELQIEDLKSHWHPVSRW